MPSDSTAPDSASLDTLHAIKNEAARAAAKRMLLDSNASDVASRIAAHEAEVARRLDLDLHDATPYGRAERVADQQRHAMLLVERDHVAEALEAMDRHRADLSRQADEALALRYTGELADLSARISERLHRFFGLWKQVQLVVKDIQTLRARHREVRRALMALGQRRNHGTDLPPEARLPHAVEDMRRAITDLARQSDRDDTPWDHSRVSVREASTAASKVS